MTYKTLLVQLDAGSRCPARIALAAHLAGVHGSHVVGIAVTGLPDIVVSMNMAVPDGVQFIEVTETFLRERAEAVAAAFEQQLAAAALRLVRSARRQGRHHRDDRPPRALQ